MNQETKVTGVILAGGLARRMNNSDKGLIPFQGRPLITYGIAAMEKAADRTIINANRNLEQYRQFGLPVVPDQTNDFNGPLAGILTAMMYAQSGVVLVMPCDAPFFNTGHLQTLLALLNNGKADVAVASEHDRLHPVFLAVKAELQDDLKTYLANGHRKVEAWLLKHRIVKSIFDEPRIFTNINTLTELSEQQADYRE